MARSRIRPCSAGERVQVLAGAGVGISELSIRGGPDTLDAATGAQKKRGGCQGYESHQKGVLDKILSLFIVPEVAKCSHVSSPILHIVACGFAEAGSDLHEIMARGNGKFIVTLDMRGGQFRVPRVLEEFTRKASFLAGFRVRTCIILKKPPRNVRF